MKKLYADAETIINESIRAALPGGAVKKTLEKINFGGPVFLFAVGKAAYKMAEAARECLGDKIIDGLVITKYGHAGKNNFFKTIEAGHPVPDDNSVAGARAALEMVRGLAKSDTVLFLISGGGSSLFELPADGLALADIAGVTEKLLACGADITEINAIRKKLSRVKGGKFAAAAAPARVVSVILSDVLGDDPATIASGPASPDNGAAPRAEEVIKKYGLRFDEKITARINNESVIELPNAETYICGSVGGFCASAAESAKRLGYAPYILTTNLNCEAREAGRFLGAIAKNIDNGGFFKPPCAVIAGGETVVTLKGNGKGGRNQELALAAAEEIAGLNDTLIFSVGSDGTDGPTDAAGGFADGGTKRRLADLGYSIPELLAANDSHSGLKACGGFIITGPTGTNVNDISVILRG